MKKRTYWLLVPLAVLLLLGGLNVYRQITWKEPTDGVVWAMKQDRLTAIKVDKDGPAYLFNLKKGDVLFSVTHNLAPGKIIIRNKIDLLKNLWQVWKQGQKITYEIYREGDVITYTGTFFPAEKGPHIIYFYLALIGLMTIIIALIVFLNSAQPLRRANIHYYLLSAFLYMFYVFSFTGEFDFLDSLFYGLDKIAFLFFPPLLIHYFLIFPQRKAVLRKRPSIAYFLYIPGALLLLVRILLSLHAIGGQAEARILQIYSTLERLDLAHFAFYTLWALTTIVVGTLRHPSFIVRKQLKWIAYGLGFGVVPFTALYVIPFVAGAAPSTAAELTVLLQALIPLSFSYSVTRYKLMDLEVIIKKASTMVFSYFVLALIYLGISSQTKIFSENKINALLLGALAIILGATVFTPLRTLVQSLFDRVFYRRSYQYRKTLLSITREFGRERNLEILASRLLEMISNALSLRSIALLLPVETGSPTFTVFSARGETGSPASGRLTFDPKVYESLVENDALSLYSVTEDIKLQTKLEGLRASGFEHFLALKGENKMVGCLAMGRKLDATFLTSEDWELLTTISSPVALAVENAYLYNQAGLRASELERLKDYSENIIESLTVGVAVLDKNGRISGWNRICEETFNRKRADVLGERLSDVISPKAFETIFPPDTQSEFHLVGEFPIDKPSGEMRIFDIAKTPLLDNLRNSYGTIVVFEDITDKVRLQQQLVTSEKLASIGLLSAGVAHEINTPLTGISSYVQMLQKKDLDENLSQLLGKIEAQTDRVSRIVKNLLTFARNPSDLAFHRVQLRDSLQEIISLIDYKLKAMAIELEIDMVPVAPIWAQGERLQQVFINIILNALDAMPNGGRLRLELAETPIEALVTISDTGTGIKEQHLPRIFDPFFTTKGVGKGTGLGLSISYAIINEHEGRIEVQSEPGKGTKFIIHLPKDLDRREKKAEEK
ncbi:MAG: ATP-binding protein [Candidatus Aminicenantales bacterium]